MRPSFFHLCLLPLAAWPLSGGSPAAHAQAPVYHSVLIVDSLTARPDGKGNFSIKSGDDGAFSFRDKKIVFRDGAGDSIWRTEVDSSGLIKLADTGVTSDAVLPGDTYTTPHTRFDAPPLALSSNLLVFLADDSFASPDPRSLYSVQIRGDKTLLKIVDATATPLEGLDEGAVHYFDGVTFDVQAGYTTDARILFCAHDGSGHYGIYSMRSDRSNSPITKIIGTGDKVRDGLGRVNTVQSLF